MSVGHVLWPIVVLMSASLLLSSARLKTKSNCNSTTTTNLTKCVSLLAQLSTFLCAVISDMFLIYLSLISAQMDLLSQLLAQYRYHIMFCDVFYHLLKWSSSCSWCFLRRMDCVPGRLVVKGQCRTAPKANTELLPVSTSFPAKMQ